MPVPAQNTLTAVIQLQPQHLPVLLPIILMEHSHRAREHLRATLLIIPMAVLLT